MLVKKYKPDLEYIMIRILANKLNKDILNKLGYATKKDWKLRD